MPEIIIRQCEKKYDGGILNVCYKTGFMGEDLLATNRFNDVKLFAIYSVFAIHIMKNSGIIEREKNGAVHSYSV